MHRKTTTASWIARVLCIAAISFVSIFAFDSFEQGTLIQKLEAFGMHMIPSFVLLIALMIAWRHELTGGIILILIGISTSLPIFNLNYNRTHNVLQCLEVVAMINFPFVIVGLLFVYSYSRLKKQASL
jgi:hypothetical protein